MKVCFCMFFHENRYNFASLRKLQFTFRKNIKEFIKFNTFMCIRRVSNYFKTTVF